MAARARAVRIIWPVHVDSCEFSTELFHCFQEPSSMLSRIPQVLCHAVGGGVSAQKAFDHSGSAQVGSTCTSSASDTSMLMFILPLRPL